jgi:hypothetical protein
MMVTILLVILMTAFGTIGITKGEFKITSTRVIDKETGKVLGILLFVGVVGTLILGSLFGIGSLIIVIIMGLASSKPAKKTDSA